MNPVVDLDLNITSKVMNYVGCSAIIENGLVSPRVKIAWQRKFRKLKTHV